MSCTYQYDSRSSASKWVVAKCGDTDILHTPNCQQCDAAFNDFRVTSQLDESVEGKSNTLCEIQKPISEMTVDDGVYVCQILKCATPGDRGCNTTPDRLQKYDILQTELTKSVKVQVY